MAGGGFVAYKMLDLIPEEHEETATDFIRNVALVGVGIAAGKKFGDVLNRTEFVNTAIHKVSPENRMHPEILKLADELDGRVGTYYNRLSSLNKDVEKLSENLRNIYRHIRFSMKCVYEEQDFSYIESSKQVSKTLLDSWSTMKH